MHPFSSKLSTQNRETITDIAHHSPNIGMNCIVSIMSVMVVIRFPTTLAMQQQLEQSTELMRPIGEIARRHGAISHRRIYRDSEFLDFDEFPSEEAYHAFRAEAGRAIDAYEEALGVRSTDDLWQVAEGH